MQNKPAKYYLDMVAKLKEEQKLKYIESERKKEKLANTLPIIASLTAITSISIMILMRTK